MSEHRGLTPNHILRVEEPWEAQIEDIIDAVLDEAKRLEGYTISIDRERAYAAVKKILYPEMS